METIIASLCETPNPVCKYNFNINNITTFVSIASALETTGESAYLGKVTSFTDEDLLEAAASIAEVESEHSAYLRFLNKKTPFPGSFKTALDSRAVISIAGQFIVSCPFDLGVTAFPALKTNQTATRGDYISLTSTQADLTVSGLFCAFLYGLTQENVALVNGTCNIPCDVDNGNLIVFVINQYATIGLLHDDYVVAGPAIIDVTV